MPECNVLHVCACKVCLCMCVWVGRPIGGGGGGGGATDCQIANLKDSCTSVPQTSWYVHTLKQYTGVCVYHSHEHPVMK